MKLLITTYYGFRESLILVNESLTGAGLEVFDYPLMMKHNEISDGVIDEITQIINDNNIDIILWWYFNVPSNIIEQIKINTKITFWIYNWDHPYDWDINKNYEKAKFIDVAFITCEESDSTSTWVKHGAGDAVCLYPGFSSRIHYPILFENNNDLEIYGCDISICCTNLYYGDAYPNQYINRKILIDDIYNNQHLGYKFKIFGPEYLKELYPDSYVKFINYEETNKVFHYSKINLCTHVLCDRDKYINERVFLILASGGILLVDDIKGIREVLGDSCFYLNKTNYIDQIVSILSNYDDYLDYKFKALELSKNYTWDKWAETIGSYCPVV